ncbi:MAG: hypothetical protein KC417_02270 [Myxococcales bacterium]|nr:hypothetical protein [Myxococcales bacterium]
MIVLSGLPMLKRDVEVVDRGIATVLVSLIAAIGVGACSTYPESGLEPDAADLFTAKADDPAATEPTLDTAFPELAALFPDDHGSATYPEGAYRVPVSSFSLERFAFAGGYRIELRRNGERVSVKYPFPNVFTGVTGQEVTLEGQVENGALHLVGEKGEAWCAQAQLPGRLECRSTMSDLASDLAQFDASFGSDWAVADKRKIAEAFINDPIGVLIVYF